MSTTVPAGDDDGDDDQVLSQTVRWIWVPHKVCMPTGFLCFFPIQKIPLWGDNFGR